MSHKKLISYSQIASFLGCRKKWYYEYVRELAPRLTAAPMQLGTLVHAYLEARLREYDVSGATAETISKLEDYFNSREVFDEEKAFYTELAERAVLVGERRFLGFIEKYEPVYIEGEPMIEFAVQVPLSADIPGVYVVGTLDLLAEERKVKAKPKWVIDHKIRKQLQPVENEEINLQMKFYKYGLMAMGYDQPIAGSISHQIYHELPKQPKLNKDGKMSRADLRTDWETYQAALIEAGLNPDDYIFEMKAKLAEKEFYRESRAFVTDKEVENVWEEIIKPTAEQIHLLHNVYDIENNEKEPRNLNIFTCTTCKMRDLCMEDLRGRDTTDLIKYNFTRNTYLDKYVAEEHEA